jgi:hypothetical protein
MTVLFGTSVAFRIRQRPPDPAKGLLQELSSIDRGTGLRLLVRFTPNSVRQIGNAATVKRGPACVKSRWRGEAIESIFLHTAIWSLKNL